MEMCSVVAISIFHGLCCLGANWFFRKVVAMVSPQLDVTQDGNRFSLKIRNLYLTKESNFSVGEEFEEAHIINGDLMKVLFVKHL